ncbi:MAG: hypothetical protein S4CHLAM7_04980 [Chlamydiae bacterium]|nr:hypothetical protein [Chlamydiota bacterium]
MTINLTTQLHDNVEALGGATPPPNKKPYHGDDALFRAMLSLVLELQVLADAQVSEAKLSSALYDNMVPNTTNQLKEMQNNLTNDTWLEEHFDAFDAYFKGKGPKPPLGPGMTPADLAQMKAFYETHNTSDSCRSAIGNLAQEVSAQNTYVQDSKVIPTDLENDVKNLANAQTQVSSFIPSFLMLMKQQYVQPW